MASYRPVPRKDGRTTYQVMYRIDGRQSSVPCADEQTAKDLVALMAQVGVTRALEIHNVSTDPVRKRGGLTVAGWLRHHIDHLTGVEQYTLDVYERYLANDISPMLGAIPLAELSEDDISRWIKHLETDVRERTGRPLAPKTIRNIYGFLSGALGAAVPKHIAANPAAGRRLPRQTGENSDDDIRMLSREEFGRLHAAVTDHWKPLVQFLVASGCRWGEATALKPSDVDRTAGTVKVRRAWKYSSAGYKVGPPKTKRSRRTINISTDTLDLLDYDHEWLFVNTAGRPVRYHGFKPKVWDRAVAKAELDPRPTPHDLRHTCASWLLAAGVPLTTVSRQLGHENVQITADVYTDVDRASFAAAADVMGKLLG